MPIREFPNPKFSDPDGLIAVGGDLHPDSLLLAYSQGIFPWPIEGLPLTWFCPPKRAILYFKNFHLSRSYYRAIKKSRWKITVNKNFEGVIRGCAHARRSEKPGSPDSPTPEAHEPKTWITPEIIKAYKKFHDLGYAHSIEVWDETTTPHQEPALIGGIYGVEVKGCFSAESMFFNKPNASKYALAQLIEILKLKGATWIDFQVLNPFTETLGAKSISRDRFLNLLQETQAQIKHLLSVPQSN